MARILVRKPQLFILDEPTSALDELTSTNLAFKLKDFAKKYGITLVVISHNSVFEEYATEILDLDDKVLAV